MKSKKDNLKKMSADELHKQLAVLQENLRSIRFKSEGSKSKNLKEPKTLRKSIARILTEMNSVKGEIRK